MSLKMDSSCTEPLINAFNTVYNNMSLHQLADEWASFTETVPPLKRKAPELKEEKYTVYVSKLIEAGEEPIQRNYIEFFCNNVVAVLKEASRFPDNPQISKLFQQAAAAVRHLTIVSKMKVSEDEVKKFFGLAKRYVLEYSVCFDKAVREKRETEERLIREKWSRINIKIISDDDDPVPEGPAAPEEDEEEPFSIATIVPRVLERKPINPRIRRKAMRTLDLDQPGKEEYSTRSTHSTVRDTERMDGRPPPVVKRPRTMIRTDDEPRRVIVHASLPNPRDLVRSRRTKMVSQMRVKREPDERRPRTAFARTQELIVPEEPEPKHFTYMLRASQKILGLLPLVPHQTEAAESSEEAMKAVLAEFRDKGVTDERSRKRLAKSFNRWRREKVPKVTITNIQGFNTACNIVDELLSDGVLVPKKIRLIETQIRRARKYADVL